MIFWGRLQPQVFVGQFGGDAAAGGALNKTELKKIGLVHIFNRIQFLRGGGSKRLQANRPAVELFYYRFHQASIGRFKAEVVNFQQVKGFGGDFFCHNALAFDFRGLFLKAGWQLAECILKKRR